MACVHPLTLSPSDGHGVIHATDRIPSHLRMCTARTTQAYVYVYVPDAAQAVTESLCCSWRQNAPQGGSNAPHAFGPCWRQQRRLAAVLCVRRAGRLALRQGQSGLAAHWRDGRDCAASVDLGRHWKKASPNPVQGVRPRSARRGAWMQQLRGSRAAHAESPAPRAHRQRDRVASLGLHVRYPQPVAQRRRPREDLVPCGRPPAADPQSGRPRL